MRGMHQRMLHAAISPPPVGGDGVEVLHQLGLQGKAGAHRVDCRGGTLRYSAAYAQFEI